MVCFLICHDNIMTNGLSNCDHIKGGSLGAQTIAAYLREGLRMNQRATPLFVALGSMLDGIVSLRVRGMCILFVTCVIENYLGKH